MSLPPGDDWRLIEKFNQGDPEAFREIFNRHKDRVLSLSYRFVQSRQAAEDIAQEVFIKIYEKRLKPDPKAKFTTWLYRVTVNASLDAVRKNKFVALTENAEILEPLSRMAVPEKAVEQRELETLLHAEIKALPENLRLPIELHQFEDLSYEEIARILNISPKAVERRLYHARERLREKLSGH